MSNPNPNIIVFGHQLLTFDAEHFSRLSAQIREDLQHDWVLQTLDELPGIWEALATALPSLKETKVEHIRLLQALSEGLKSGRLQPELFPLPNIVLTPLVVAAQLIQYAEFLKATFPGASFSEEFSSPERYAAEALGLCTGLLSTFAIISSSSFFEFRGRGATALRLAAVIGALVDTEDEKSPSKVFSASWVRPEVAIAMNKMLDNFSEASSITWEAYIAVQMDEKRQTITANKDVAPILINDLRSAGAHVAEVDLRGSFHSVKHQANVEQLIQFCDVHPGFQLPDASKALVPTRLGKEPDRYLVGNLHELAIRAILVQRSEWYHIFKSSYSANGGAKVLCFGSDHCVPPTIARQLGSRLVYVSEVDLSTSDIPSHLLSPRTARLSDDRDDRIAVVGMACHLPGAQDLEDYWHILLEGQSQHREITTERFKMETIWRELDTQRKWYGNFIDNFDAFDHKFFKKNPRETASTDPQQRIMLQLAYQALEQSGYFDAGQSFDKHIACYLGIANVDYEHNIANYPADAFSATGNLKSFLAGKISHQFGWTGPSLTLDTACSSSTVAIHHACRAILTGECTSALAGGINILTSPEWYQNLAAASFLSPTGQCKPFDICADGYCRGEGGAVVFLKKLSAAVADGDQVFGVVAGTRVYQNQNYTAITVPNAPSLSNLFEDTLRQAGLRPNDITVVEAHGTGTAVGDPAEYDSVRAVFGGPQRSDTLCLTSVKGLIGHTESASGAASLLKVLLMIDRGLVPQQASFTSLNPALKARREDMIVIPTSTKPWDAPFRAALINNYGASGSNASMVVVQHRTTTDAPKALPSNKPYPFWFSAFGQQSMRAWVAKFRRWLQTYADADASTGKLNIANLSFQVARQSNRCLPQALIVSASSATELEQKLEEYENTGNELSSNPNSPPRPVILCLGGQVSTSIGLDKEVYHASKTLRKHLDDCNETCLSLEIGGIFPIIFERSPIEDTVKLQTTLFALQYSCARAWIDSGAQISAIVGHSFGELTGLCVSGALSLGDTMRLIAGRARLIRDRWGAEKGSMLAVEADSANVEKLLAISDVSSVSIACYNSPTFFTLAGSTQDLDEVSNRAQSDVRLSHIKTKKLDVTNAFHSSLAEPLLVDMENLCSDLEFRQPALRLEHATEREHRGALNGSYVAEHLRKPVFFKNAVQRLAQDFPNAVWLEAGSASTVTSMASRALESPSSAHFQPLNITKKGAFQSLVDGTMRLWKAGLNTCFWAHHKSQVSEYTPVILPPYQFERSRHWLDLKDPPKPQLVVPIAQALPEEPVPKRLATLYKWQDELLRSARFRINTKTEQFEALVSAHIIVKTAPVIGMFQLEIAVDALMQVRPEFDDMSYQPELQGMWYHNPLVPAQSKSVWLDATCIDDDSLGLTWEWKILSSEGAGAMMHHTTGRIVFHPCGDAHLQDRFDKLFRLSGRQRCLSLLEDGEKMGREVLQGQSIYRAFEPVMDYKRFYQHVSKLVGFEDESAGRVRKGFEGDSWIDMILTDCFCQVAGLFVNLMTAEADIHGDGVFICDRIDSWLRNPRLGARPSLPDTWDVLALHHRQSETNYISDIFAFDPRDGSLYEVIHGVSYQRVSVTGLRTSLSQDLPAPSESLAGRPRANSTLPGTALSRNTVSSLPKAREIVNGASSARSKPKKKGPDVPDKCREILCNLSGLEKDEVKDDSDLVELGIDSLMSMELTREVDAAFRVTLKTDHLMDMTDFNSLVMCISSLLDLDGQDADGTGESDDEGQTNGIQCELNGNTVINEVNGINGSRGPDGNGVLSTGYNNHALQLPADLIWDSFHDTKAATDDFIVNGQLGTYYDGVMPRSTELCVVYILDAFEQLGCNIRTACPGQNIERVPYLEKHERFMNLIYRILEKDARLIDIHGSTMIRTSVAPPPKPANILLEELLRDEPVHEAEHRLTRLTGEKFADCITGKQDGLQLIFGTAEGKEVATNVYAKSPINAVWIQQAECFLERLIRHLPQDGQPLRILEMGAGTGGTTAKILPLLERLGVPVIYTMTDLSSSLIAAARKRFKEYSFMEFKTLNIESEPDAKLVRSQHIILATNCVHATRDLTISTTNIHRILRPDGFLLLLEMTVQVPWVDFIFGLLEGWWLFEDGRHHALQPPQHWEKILHSVGYGHVDWTDGARPEANLQRLIIAHASGQRYARASPPPPLSDCPEGESELTHVADRKAVIDTFVRKYTHGLVMEYHQPRASSRSSQPLETATPGRCVLVTGATGSLGSHVVAYAARLSQVQTVVCLNRPGTVDAITRQANTLQVRGINLDPACMAKFRVLEADTSKPLLGLTPEEHQFLVDNVTDIVASAWPMSLTRPTSGYVPQFRTMRNLIDLALQATCNRPAPFRFGFQFISSISVVGYYPLVTGRTLVPEEAATVEGVFPVGYSDAKLVCERMLDETLHRQPTRLRAMTVRIAQIAGSTTSGYWNPVEQFPFLVRSSQVLKALPDLQGTLSFMPVNDVAAALGELLLLSDARPYPIYQIENPSRQPWPEMMTLLADGLDIPRENIVPFDKWLGRVRRFRGSLKENPAAQLLDFFEKHFRRMACGGLVLQMEHSKEHSETMRSQGPLDPQLMLKYIACWKQAGFLS